MGCAPTDRIEVDRAAMLTLPPVAPVTGWRTSLRLPRDHYVRLDGNDYSVHPGAIGRRIEVVADLERVRAFSDGRLVADHVRSWARHQTFTDPAHADAATVLRREHRQHVSNAARALRAAEVDVEERSLSSYDIALGVNLGGDVGAALGADDDLVELARTVAS